jgi:hypothetical protein
MNPEDNPYIAPQNYLSGYQDSLNQFQETANQIELDRLCFEVFVANETGRKLMEVIKSRYIHTATPFKIGPDYKYACIYYEGLRQAYRGLEELAMSYKHRKEHEALRAEIEPPKGDRKA